MLRQEDLEDLAATGLIADRTWRLPGDEIEPQPRADECVLLATHVDCGFSLPLHPFFRGFLNFFGAQLHHFSPNTIKMIFVLIGRANGCGLETRNAGRENGSK